MNEEKLIAPIKKVSLFEQALLSMRIQRLVNIQDLSIYLGMSMTYIRELVKAGVFPKPIQEGRYLKWDIVEIDHYIESKKAERDSTESATTIVNNQRPVTKHDHCSKRTRRCSKKSVLI